MQVELRRLDAAGLRIFVPLWPSRSHMGTGFAGALQAALTLAGWGLTAALLADEAPCDLVAQTSTVKFLHPVRDDFESIAAMPDATRVTTFLTQYRRRGRARLQLNVEAWAGEQLSATGEVRYAALRQSID